MNITNTAKTLKAFLEEFAPTYSAESVPVGQDYPFITYEMYNSEYGEEGTIQVRIYTKGPSIAEACRITDKLEAKIGHAGTLAGREGGLLWIYKGDPFAQQEPTPDDQTKAMYIVLSYRNF